MSGRDDLREHLKYYRDLGVAGVTTDPVWRERAHPAPSTAHSAPSEAHPAPSTQH